jgi:hypothetical protein
MTPSYLFTGGFFFLQDRVTYQINLFYVTLYSLSYFQFDI